MARAKKPVLILLLANGTGKMREGFVGLLDGEFVNDRMEPGELILAGESFREQARRAGMLFCFAGQKTPL